MSFVTIGAADIRRLLPMRECIELMARAFIDLDRGALSQPLRSMWALPKQQGVMAWMPSYRSGSRAAFGMKVLCVLPGNPQKGLDTHQGQVLLSDGETGQLRAVLDASAVTSLRTAAVSALATRLLARADARTLAIIGTGAQARSHLEAIPMVRSIERVRVAGRTPDHARQLVSEVAAGFPFPVEASPDAQTAVHQADIIVTATSSPIPVLARAWLAPGTHINGIGASRSMDRELDVDTIADALLFTDRRDSIENEAGDYRMAVQEGRAPVARELGELLNGKVEGRTSDGEITLFRSLGLGVEDLSAAEYIVARAHETGTGVRVDF